MKTHEELIARLAQRRSAKLGNLSKSGFEELLRAVQAKPKSFIDDPRDEAFSVFIDALERYEKSAENADFIDADDAFFAARSRRLNRLIADCDRALALDENCADASLCKLLAQDLAGDDLIEQLFTLRQNLAHNIESEPLLGPHDDSEDVWDDVFTHGMLRVQSALSRALFDTARYRMAEDVCRQLLDMAPSDMLGARHTCALILARLEDEDAFEELDVHYGRHGDSWSHLARVILLFKLNRISAAKRALLGYSNLVEGGAYALLRPVLVDTYIPDRPGLPACSFSEATLATHEADPIIVDTPDLVPWAEEIPQINSAARNWAEQNDFDW